MPELSVAKRGVRALRSKGPGYVAASLVDLALERALRVQSRDYVPLEDTGDAAANRAAHSASSWIPLWRSLRALRPLRTEVFLDYGAGKGRTMIVAQRMGFGAVIGVEVSEQLAAAARENLARQKRRPGAEAARVIVADASEWEPPPEVTVAFMYSPFTGPVFAAAIGRLLDSLDRHPRRMRLVYNNPFEHNYLLDTGRFRAIDAIPGTWPHKRDGMTIVTYEVVGEGVPRLPRHLRRVGKWAGRVDTSSLMPAGYDSAAD
jgi:SAM-dependent methyltransferase